MAGSTGRDTSADELREAFIRSTHRLSRHISDHLAGEYAAIDDVAALLRTLCAFGRGDGLVDRVVRQFKLTPPRIRYERAADPITGTQVTLGALPLIRSDNGSFDVTLNEWLRTPAAAFVDPATSRRTEMRWEKLIGQAANTWGSHATEVIAPWFDASQLINVHELTMVDYMIERASLAVEDRISYLLRELGEDLHAPPLRALPVRPVGIEWLRVSIRDGNVLDIEALGGGHSGTPDGLYPLIRVQREGIEAGLDMLRLGGQDALTISPIRKL